MQLIFSTAIWVLAILQAALSANAQQIYRPNQPPPACKIAGNSWNPVTCPGGFIQQFPTQPSTIQGCSEKCRQNPDCRSFAVHQGEDLGCWLYGGNATVCAGPILAVKPGWFFDRDCYMCPAPPPCPECPNPPSGGPADIPCPEGKTPGCNCICVTREEAARRGLENAPCQNPNKVGCACGRFNRGLWGYCAK